MTIQGRSGFTFVKSVNFNDVNNATGITDEALPGCIIHRDGHARR